MAETSKIPAKEFKLNTILLSARTQKASDAHFKVGSRPVLRIKGKLIPLDTEECTSEKMNKLSSELLTQEQKERLPSAKSIDTSYEVNNYRHRVNVALETKNGKVEPFIAIRLIPEEIMHVEDVGFPYEVWKDITGYKDLDEKKAVPELRRGLVLVTGKTGSGKTTTLASLINYMNMTRAEHIITLEDPIEYSYPKGKSIISQREIGTSLNSFADGVKYSLREDPDIILVGEIRDRETALHALEASETGHLVLSTLHTKSATETVDRYVSLFESNEQDKIRTSLASNLAFVFSQLLVPCRKGTERKLVMEVMNVRDTSSIRNHIREGDYKQLLGDMQSARKYNNITFDHRLLELYTSGELEDMAKEEVLSYAHNPESLKLDLNKLR
jgi:twitching motility protein PilT